MLKPGYKQTDLGVLPEEWEVEKLVDLTIKVGSGITPTGGNKIYQDSGRPFVRSQNIDWGGLLLDDIAYISEEIHNTFSSTEIKEKDVLLNITGASIGRAAVADKRIVNGNVNQHVCIIRSDNERLIPNYLCSFLLSFKGQATIDSFQAGGNRQGLNFEQIKSFLIPLPPPAEQQAIAEALGAVDTLLTAQRELLAKKRDLKQATQQALLSGERRLPGFVGEWETRPLSSEIEGLDSGVSVNSIVEEGKPQSYKSYILKTSAAFGGVFKYYEAKRIIDKDLTRARLNPKAGSIIISRMNTIDLVGECAYIDKDYRNLFVPDRLWQTRLFSSSQVDTKWLTYVLASDPYKRQLKDIATGTSGSMKNIAKDAFLAIEVKFPLPAEQRAIATILSDMDAELEALASELAKTQALKQGLMQDLLTGTIRLTGGATLATPTPQ